MSRAKETQRVVLTALGLAVVTCAAFWRVLFCGFINYDDQAFVTENPHVLAGLTWEGFRWAWSTMDTGIWQPLSWLSHMLVSQLQGQDPGGHHLANLLLHTASTLILFLALRKLTGAHWRSAWVAALFGIHPLHVESVAWVSERKDVLCGFFFMLTLWCYARFTTPPNPNRNLHPNPPFGSLWYWLTLLAFACGLMSKSMIVTLPFVLLLLDFWPLRRISIPLAGTISLRRVLLEKMPFFALSAAICVLTLKAQTHEGAVVSLAHLPLESRLANSALAAATYLLKAFWPSPLAIFYPQPESVSWLFAAAAVVLLVVITGWVCWSATRQAYRATGWFWFLGMLVPVIGIVQVGMQEMADRYTYLPLIGIFILIAWEAAELFPHRIVSALALLTIPACIAGTWIQTGYWRDSEQLFTHALAVTRGNYVAHDNLGLALYQRGAVDEAIGHYRQALVINPRHDDAMRNLARALADKGELAESESQFRAALALRPRDAATHNNLGNVLAIQGRHAEAIAEFQEALALQPDILSARNNLAISYESLGRPAEAVVQYRAALQIQPDFPAALNNLAWILATSSGAELRNGPEALRLATRACEVSKYQELQPLITLAAAYAEAGDFESALSYADRARSLARDQPAQLGRLQVMSACFQARKPYHMGE